MYWLLVGLLGPIGRCSLREIMWPKPDYMEPACITSGSLNIMALELLENMENPDD